MERMTVSLPGGQYDIQIAPGLLFRVGECFDLDRRALVVTDAGVPPVYAATVAQAARAGRLVTLPGGEGCKTLRSVETLLDAMLSAGFSRRDCVVAVGGGVVGDTAGFAAACYMRGIDFYNIPTTLLSQVDSSVGGKTGVNFGGVKNIVGSFYQPRGVLIDPLTLETLDDRTRRAGMAEVIKMAATSDAALFARLENSRDTAADLPAFIRGALAVKIAVVEADEREGGARRILNFGHTVGHAIEACRAGTWQHGECVAAGMPVMCEGEARARVRAVLARYGLPTRVEERPEELRPYLVHDKKAGEDGRIAAVYVATIGAGEIRDTTADEILARVAHEQEDV